MHVYRFHLFLVFGLLAACVAAPVQEMSDARQAIESAKAVGADDYTNTAMREASLLLEQAQSALESHRYRDARRMATEAKSKAISARIFVQQEDLYPNTRQVE